MKRPNDEELDPRWYELKWFDFLDEKGYGKCLPRTEVLRDLSEEFRKCYPYLKKAGDVQK